MQQVYLADSQKFKINKTNIKSMGSGHYQLYQEIINEFKKSGSIEVVPFKEAIFTQNKLRNG